MAHEIILRSRPNEGSFSSIPKPSDNPELLRVKLHALVATAFDSGGSIGQAKITRQKKAEANLARVTIRTLLLAGLTVANETALTTDKTITTKEPPNPAESIHALVDIIFDSGIANDRAETPLGKTNAETELARRTIRALLLAGLAVANETDTLPPNTKNKEGAVPLMRRPHSRTRPQTVVVTIPIVPPPDPLPEQRPITPPPSLRQQRLRPPSRFPWEQHSAISYTAS